MKLFYSVNSPYARKCRVAVIEKGLEKHVEFVLVNPLENPPQLLAVNPLATVPTLVLSKDSTVLCESPVICEYIDSLSPEQPLIPADPAKRFPVLGLAALADGIMDAAVACVLEGRKPEDKRSPEWIIRKETAIKRTIAAIADLPFSKGMLDIGYINTAVALAYVHFRLPHIRWHDDHMALAVWFEDFALRSSMQATAPVA